LIFLAVFSHTIYKELNHFKHGISSGLDDPNRRQAPAERVLMAATNGTILNLLFNGLIWAGASWLAFSSWVKTQVFGIARPDQGIEMSRYFPLLGYEIAEE
jgi:hypothetical protein